MVKQVTEEQVVVFQYEARSNPFTEFYIANTDHTGEERWNFFSELTTTLGI